jgi:hypothetical protein
LCGGITCVAIISGMISCSIERPHVRYYTDLTKVRGVSRG